MPQRGRVYVEKDYDPAVPSLTVRMRFTLEGGVVDRPAPPATSPSLWTRLYCALWWGHRPVRVRPYSDDYACDRLTCRCGKVTENTEDVVRYLT